MAAILVGSVGCGRTVRNSVPPRVSASGGWVDLNAAASGPHVARRAPDCPRNVLALSAGGSYGAYSAGLLNGWTEAGSRPEFDVVTGVSTGALASTYAFLGPRYDAELKRLFTTVSDRDIFRRRGPLAPLRSESIASSAPLRRLIEGQITPQVIAEVADAHARGRRLYVGTTNLDSKRLVVWDMGAIAARGDARLYTDVLLASASIPGMFPPVEIEVEVNGRRHVEPHADGGIAAQVFVKRFMLTGTQQGDATPGGATVWVVIAGKLYADPSSTGKRTLDIGVNAVNTMLYAQSRNDVRRIAALARETRSEFRLTSVPEDYPVCRSEQMFDPEVMGRLFEIGQALGRSGSRAWRGPLSDADDTQDPPRTGTQFLAPEQQR